MPALVLNFVLQSWLVILEMAPYLLFGFALAGLMSIWISPEWTERHLGGKGLGPVVKATLLGIPLPLCSCSVIPVVASMRRHGASRAAATSFLLSTPQTGVDSIAVTYALLGPIFAIFRPIAALVTGVMGGALVLLFGRTNSPETDVPPPCTDSCCAGDGTAPVWRRAAKYGLVTLPRDLAWPLLVGVAIAGAIAVKFPAHSLEHLGGGLPSILVLMAAGIPLYVCATASVPIAAGLIRLGASPGAALAFLIVGAATNAATVTTVWKVMGRRTTVIYLVTVGVSALLCGLVLDGLSTWLVHWLPEAAACTAAACVGHAAEPGGFWPNLWAVVLLAVLLAAKLPAGGRHEKPSAAPLPVPKPQPSCGCGCSDRPLHQLTKK